MKIIRRLAWALPLAAATCGALAQDAGPKQQEFRSKSGTGRVVVVISGQTGMTPYAGVAQKFADAGFNVTLVDGNDFWIADTRRGWGLLRQVITRAQAGPSALPGKVGVVGYSMGGASALTYAARMPELVATVVATYPLTSFITDPADFVAKLKVPVQVYTGTADRYKDCCLIEMARRLAAAATAGAVTGSAPPLVLREYDGVGHGFNLPDAALKDEAAGQDALARTVAHLKQALP